MSAPTTLVAYALLLVAVFAAALGVGRVVGPVGTAGTGSAGSTEQHSTRTEQHTSGTEQHG